jgi:predicted phosphodiesterase
MRLGFITDIHEDVKNLEKALSILSDQKCDVLICLGDIVGFTIPFYRYIETRNAEECVRLVKENASVVVTGNHDLFAIKEYHIIKQGLIIQKIGMILIMKFVLRKQNRGSGCMRTMRSDVN